MHTILKITHKGIEKTKINEKTFFIIDAKEFLQSLFENLFQEKVNTLDRGLATLIKEAKTLLEEEYNIAPNEQQDLVNLFSAMNPANIFDKPSLLEAHKQSIRLKKLVDSSFLTKEEQRIICLAFFNDGNLTSKIDNLEKIEEIKPLERKSLLFKKSVKQFLATKEADNKSINAELYRPFLKAELPVFDALLQDYDFNSSIQSATQKAYKSSQNIVSIKTKRKIANVLKHIVPKASATWENK